MTRASSEIPLELDFMSELMLALGRHPDVTLWRQNVGKVVVRNRAGKALRTFNAGPPKGAADISGFVKPEGWRLEIETKGARGKRSEDQERFANNVTRGGCIYVLADYQRDLDLETNVKRAVALVEAAIAERRGRKR